MSSAYLKWLRRFPLIFSLLFPSLNFLTISSLTPWWRTLISLPYSSLSGHWSCFVIVFNNNNNRQVDKNEDKNDRYLGKRRNDVLQVKHMMDSYISQNRAYDSEEDAEAGRKWNKFAISKEGFIWKRRAETE